ncbi:MULTISPECIES: hypothetical protein [Sphingobium]|nr:MULTISPECIES: hypothetical protein [Sphingobium]QDC36660.1 hypothetical protein FIL70_04810 [Sphingobium fuliginis ATCC 27551]QHD66757.1 hypothetical protein GS397_06630 [Sphingobium yanoikuyae]QNG43854.1 hypothetical protein H3V42_18215 [Sphingobium yanoikuyae]
MMTQYSQASLETAACLWEAILSLRDQPVTNPDALALSLDIRKAFEALGTATLRMTVVGWTDAVDAAWREAADDFTLCFDWDFVPGWIIDHVDWSDPMRPAVIQRGGGEVRCGGELVSADQEQLP